MAASATCRASRLCSKCPIPLPVRRVVAIRPARPRGRVAADSRTRGSRRSGRRARRRRRHDHRSRRRPGAPDRRRYAGDGPSGQAGRVLRQGSQRVHEAPGGRQAGAPGVRPAADRPLRADAGVRPPAGRHVRQRRDHQARLRPRLHPFPLQAPRAGSEGSNATRVAAAAACGAPRRRRPQPPPHRQPARRRRSPAGTTTGTAASPARRPGGTASRRCPAAIPRTVTCATATTTASCASESRSRGETPQPTRHARGLHRRTVQTPQGAQRASAAAARAMEPPQTDAGARGNAPPD